MWSTIIKGWRKQREGQTNKSSQSSFRVWPEQVDYVASNFKAILIDWIPVTCVDKHSATYTHTKTKQNNNNNNNKKQKKAKSCFFVFVFLVILANKNRIKHSPQFFRVAVALILRNSDYLNYPLTTTPTSTQQTWKESISRELLYGFEYCPKIRLACRCSTRKNWGHVWEKEPVCALTYNSYLYISNVIFTGSLLIIFSSFDKTLIVLHLIVYRLLYSLVNNTLLVCQ